MEERRDVGIGDNGEPHLRREVDVSSPCLLLRRRDFPPVSFRLKLRHIFSGTLSLLDLSLHLP